MKAPCGRVYMHDGTLVRGRAQKSGPWILAATILGSRMAFIDSTIVIVAAAKLRRAF
jgi:hypothetical protein